MCNKKLSLLIIFSCIFINMRTNVNEEVTKINNIIHIISESKTIDVKLPIKISGSYYVPKSVPNRGDALHSFDARLADGFGGYMLRGNPPSKWQEYIKFNQGKSINQTLIDLWKQGVNPDVTNLKIEVDSRNYSVKWSATIDYSSDDKAYIGMSTVGSAGQSADSRALGQVASLKTRIPGAKDYTLVLDFKNTSGIYIRQYFYKWTIPGSYKPHKGSKKRIVKQTIPTNDDIIKKDKELEVKKPNDSDFDINNVISTLDKNKIKVDIDPEEYSYESDNFTLLDKFMGLGKS